MEESPHKNYEDHLAGKRTDSWSHYNVVHKFFLCLKAMKLPDAKAAAEKEWENSTRFQRGT